MGVPKSLLEHRLVYLPEFPVVLPVQENDVVSLFAAADPTRVHEKMDDPVPAGVAEHRAESESIPSLDVFGESQKLPKT